jgi:hypothetical protein
MSNESQQERSGNREIQLQLVRSKLDIALIELADEHELTFNEMVLVLSQLTARHASNAMINDNSQAGE